MEHSVREQDGVTVIAPRGPIDVSDALTLRDLLAGPVGGAGNRVLVDLSEVTLVDSSGIGILVTAHRQAEASGAALALGNPVGPVGRVFEMTRTNKLLRIYPTVDEALAALRGG
ncbi:MAG: STAS domain-containing protein [Thermoleophilia bacterium]|nr:STAS domain-containing protein [Thermoleophilia bacterium]